MVIVVPADRPTRCVTKLVKPMFGTYLVKPTAIQHTHTHVNFAEKKSWKLPRKNGKDKNEKLNQRGKNFKLERVHKEALGGKLSRGGE